MRPFFESMFGSAEIPHSCPSERRPSNRRHTIGRLGTFCQVANTSELQLVCIFDAKTSHRARVAPLEWSGPMFRETKTKG